MSLIQKALERQSSVKKPEIDLDTFLKKPTEKLPPLPKKELPQEPAVQVALPSGTKGSKSLVFILLALAQAAVLAYFLFCYGPHPTGRQAAAVLSEQKTPAVSEMKIASKPAAVEPVSATARKMALNPVTIVLPKSKAKNRFVLSGISVNGGEKYAVINDKIFGLGEEVGKGAKILDILDKEKKVIIEEQGRQIILQL
jgi:hypothetical protein